METSLASIDLFRKSKKLFVELGNYVRVTEAFNIIRWGKFWSNDFWQYLSKTRNSNVLLYKKSVIFVVYFKLHNNEKQ